MKFSLGLILALCLAGLQFVAVTIVVFSSFLTSEKVLLEHARDLLSDVGTNTIEHSKGFLKPAKGAAELATRLAENQVIASDDFNQLENLLFQQLQISPQFAGVFYGDEAGNFVYVMRSEGPGPFRTKIVMRDGEARETELIWRDSNYQVLARQDDKADTYDPRTRPWYQSSRENLTGIWTDPYIFFTSQRPGITAASPVFNTDGGLRGVVGVDIEIGAISGFLSRLNIGKSGVALILNRNGDVIAHPNQALIRKQNPDGTFRFVNINEIDDPVAHAAFADVVRGSEVYVDREVASRFEFDGSTYVSTVMPAISDELPWTIAVYAPEADFTGEITGNRTQNVWIAATIALASGVVGLMLANYIHKPVRAFAVRSSLVSQGEASAEEPLPKTYKELERANETLVQAIAERKKSEAEYDRTFDLAARGMARIQAHTGKILRINRRLADLLGYSEVEALDLTIQDISHPSDPVAKVFTASSGGGRSEYFSEKRYRHKDGTTIWVSENVIVIRDDNDVPVYAVVAVDDISERIAADLKIQQLNTDLSHSARINMMGQMATGLAHELNQPLLAISQNMDTAVFLLKDTDQKASALRELLVETDRHAHRAGDIIKALRAFVKKEGAEKTEFDFAELMEQSLHLMRAEAKDHGISITATGSNLEPVYGSRVQIAQVLVNMLRNAIESIAQSNMRDRKVTLKAENTQSGAMISVTDTGPGLQEDVDVFEHFKTTKKDGMGMGLSICRTIVESHRGEIWYQQDPDGNPQFCFTLPALKPKTEVGKAYEYSH
ncbi:cache domain-containing protein [Roseobacter litoralis]|uniref:histidine kinase n=1 Tax=Roseobacter litoralis (strain ATCC 49566 / DSM 6996 / JCM 21268 / NBRC 15278 / OCh 149) TaxID=391595 RepID=F7ZBA0_ROSLO|nr:cache domain-containing protein [Roseobacter litoralis]AEI94286.1 sensor transduction histidine kinase [Roseobacter litoralis Och 149]